MMVERDMSNEMEEKVMKGIKRILSAAMAAVLTAGLITGCGTKDQGKKTDNPTTGGEPVAMGRYRETEVTLPKEIKDQLVYTIFKGKDGKIELYTATQLSEGIIGEIMHYVFDNGTWTKDENWWGTALLKQYNLGFNKVVYGMDGHYYLSGMDEKYQYHLYQVAENGTGTEMIPEVFLPPEGKDYGMIPRKIAVNEAGNILLYSYHESYLYTPDGQKLFTMPQDFSGTTDDKNMYSQGDDFVTVLDGAVVRYSLTDGQVKETIPYDGLSGGADGSSAILFPDENGGIYVANEAGLAHVNKGGTVWENLIDGSLNLMGMRSLTMQAFMAGDHDDYYGFYAGEMGKELSMYRYAYDPDLASVPPVTLTVYALHDNSTVRQASALFQKDNPDVHVEFRAAIQSEDSGSMTEEVIRSLNTELLSGKGADILILDGLPVDSYIEKGVLMDMRDVFAEIQAEAPLSPNIVESFTREDGSIYEMPARFALPVVMGGEKAIAAFDTMKNFGSYEGKRPLLTAETYENILRLMANVFYKELFQGGLEHLDGELLTKYLETAKSFSEKNGSKVEFTEEEMNENMVNSNVIISGIRGYAMSYDQGLCDGSVEYFDSIFSSAIAWAVMDKNPGMEMKSLNGIYYPSSLAGINQATAQKETAESFIKYLFSTQVQKENFYDGLPVQEAALELLRGESNDHMSYMIGSSVGDYTLTAGWPSADKVAHMMDMVPQLTVPVIVDENVMEMIVSESKDYFDGKATVEQAVSAVSQKLKLYLTE